MAGVPAIFTILSAMQTRNPSKGLGRTLCDCLFSTQEGTPKVDRGR